MKLSIIIPCYNCAPVIVRCMESIDYDDMEIIVVNDGSTDNSAEVVEQYADTHPYVHLINKPNGGVSSARNMGIQHATGKYIMFMDADDYQMRDGLCRIVDVAEQTNADIVKFALTRVMEGEPIVIKSLKDFDMQYEIIEGQGRALLRHDISDYHVVDAIFRRDVIADNNVLFDTSLTLHEDDMFMGQFFCHASMVVITNLPLYYYIICSNFSTISHQSVERQRVLIASEWKAAIHRKEYVQKYVPEALPLERLKYMRFVCSPSKAVLAGYSYNEYIDILDRYKNLDLYPLEYRWINVGIGYMPWKKKLKAVRNTFLTNHPWLGYWIYRARFAQK